MESSSVIDERIIDRAIRGDKEAFSVIVRGSGDRTLVVAERILRSPEEAVFAVQRLFVTAFSSLNKLRGKGFLETWLLQMLVSVCGERLKAKDKKLLGKGVVVPYAPYAGPAAIPLADSIERAADRLSKLNARSKVVRRTVDELPFKERAAVMFRDWDGLSAIEVAEILRTSREDVRKLLINSRKTLMDKLGNGKVGGKCGKKCDRLWLFVGGELGQTEQQDLISHLERCPACRDYLARASVVVEALREAAPVEQEPPIASDKLWKDLEPLLKG